MSGPATATMAISRRGLRRLCALTGTGFAQPKPATTKASAPSGSIWGSGLRVMRPWSLPPSDRRGDRRRAHEPVRAASRRSRAPAICRMSRWMKAAGSPPKSSPISSWRSRVGSVRRLRLVGKLRTRDAVALVEPRAEVDQSARERAERAVRIAGPGDGGDRNEGNGHGARSRIRSDSRRHRSHGPASCQPWGWPSRVALTSRWPFARVGAVAASLPPHGPRAVSPGCTEEVVTACSACSRARRSSSTCSSSRRATS